MKLSEFGKELIECVELNEEKAAELFVDKVVLHALKKVVEDTTNPFDDQAYAILAPLIGPKVKEVLKESLGKLGA